MSAASPSSVSTPARPAVRLDVAEVTGGFCSTEQAGARLREALLPYLEAGQVVTLDWIRCTVFAAPFWRALTVPLLARYDRDTLNRLVRVESLCRWGWDLCRQVAAERQVAA